MSSAYPATSDPVVATRIGSGTAIAQFGELFQGALRDPGGRLHRCLVSLPCTAISASARFVPGAGDGVMVSPPHKLKAARAANLTLQLLDRGRDGGELHVDSTIPEAKGCGSSTADCVAAVRAVACAYGRTLTEPQVAKIVVAAERASGNVMFRDAVMFAHREGAALEEYHRPLPQLAVLGFDTEPSGVVDTLEFPAARYSSAELDLLHVLAAGLRRAIKDADLHMLGRIATASAKLNEKFLPKQSFQHLQQIAGAVNALGIAVAHSGTVAALLFDPGDPGWPQRADEGVRRLTDLGVRSTLRFCTE